MWNDRVIAAVRAWPDDTMDLRRYGLDRLHLGNGRMGAVNTLLPAIKYMPQSDRERIADLLFQESGAQAERLMLNAEEIQQLHGAGMEIGGHTESHPILTALPDAAAEIEIANNKATLEGIIGQEVVSFAYPNGRPQRDYDPRHVGMLKKLGYRYAFTTAPGTATAATDPLQMPRFTPWDRSRKRYLSRLLMNYFRNPEHVPDKVEMA